MTDNEWLELSLAVQQRYLDAGKSPEKARKLASEYMRQRRLEVAEESLKGREGK